ncbi:hypothetical protein SAMN05216219_1160 [Mycetocola miduiensis]|uniref:Uncharacterized protein n=1 Tax=Mycetocola miduiensis TaxID=995034 RepID=A0A1I4ZXJ9_9MICO|nr:hypothetical protein SAMN05216219_1160 [Mycetocola miduiensis]
MPAWRTTDTPGVLQFARREVSNANAADDAITTWFTGINRSGIPSTPLIPSANWSQRWQTSPVNSINPLSNQ